MIPCSFDYLIYPYYPAYTMGCYQIVISGDNGREGLLFVLLVCNFYGSTKGGEMQLHSPHLFDSFTVIIASCHIGKVYGLDKTNKRNISTLVSLVSRYKAELETQQSWCRLSADYL